MGNRIHKLKEIPFSGSCLLARLSIQHFQRIRILVRASDFDYVYLCMSTSLSNVCTVRMLV